MTQTLRLLCLALLMAAPIFAQSATPQYSVIELPASTTTLDQFRYAVAINNAGQIVGTAHLFGNDVAVLWDHGPQIPIGGLNIAGPDGRATDINERGQMVWNRREVVAPTPFCGKAVSAARWIHWADWAPPTGRLLATTGRVPSTTPVRSSAAVRCGSAWRPLRDGGHVVRRRDHQTRRVRGRARRRR